MTSDYNGDDVSCAGVCDGEITITMTGGSTYGYQIYHQNTGTYYPGPTSDDFQASNVFPNLCQGDYDITVLDSAIVYIPGVLYGECSGFETISGAQGLTASFNVLGTSLLHLVKTVVMEVFLLILQEEIQQLFKVRDARYWS